MHLKTQTIYSMVSRHVFLEKKSYFRLDLLAWLIMMLSNKPSIYLLLCLQWYYNVRSSRYSEAATPASNTGLTKIQGACARRSKKFYEKGIFRLKVHFIIGSSQRTPSLSAKCSTLLSEPADFKLLWGAACLDRPLKIPGRWEIKRMKLYSLLGFLDKIKIHLNILLLI